MPYLNDTQRVEMSLPAHMMLAVLVVGANCADPGPPPLPRTMQSWSKWQHDWRDFKRKLDDPVFANGYREFLRTKDLLAKACAEPLQDLLPRKASSLLRRIETIHHQITVPYTKVKEPDPRKIGLITYYLINLLVETRYLIIPEDSAFGLALDVMLPGLSPWEGSTEAEIEAYEKLNKSAQKQLRTLIETLQRKDYYRELKIPENY